MWFCGPEFLWQTEIPTPDACQKLKVPSDDCELKRVQTFKTEVEEVCEPFSENFKRFSSWTRLKRVIALCRRYIQNLNFQVNKRRYESNKVESLEMIKSNISPVLSVNELEKAEQDIVKIIQLEAFESDMKTLECINKGQGHDNACLKRSSPVYRLDPF